ncbi:hypothetical protein LTR20_007363 [Exophiala xenobiotica]|nr:hypothetical protein LTS06_008043 [Exophiala xenobiotica]KAK5283505.1 hypothetical protein LTR40_001648 [Exophiala xenobiotica]KAK5371029.1 hypothetical protein LTS13_006406 [Exophiala xenobiotica]KAK5401226.1 hypothetical protein LTR79_001745 [Exophiala xenobiotica]KAK5409153.1 hypothetical protein LTR90_009276 [Exophiala xenobiotica]
MDEDICAEFAADKSVIQKHISGGWLGEPGMFCGLKEPTYLLADGFDIMPLRVVQLTLCTGFKIFDPGYAPHFDALEAWKALHVDEKDDTQFFKENKYGAKVIRMTSMDRAILLVSLVIIEETLPIERESVIYEC